MPRWRLVREVPRSELVYWMAVYQLDPWGEQRADYRNAQAIVMAMRAAGVKQRFKLGDFMDFRIVEEPESAATASTAVHPVQALLERVAAEGRAADVRKTR